MDDIVFYRDQIVTWNPIPANDEAVSNNLEYMKKYLHSDIQRDSVMTVVNNVYKTDNMIRLRFGNKEVSMFKKRVIPYRKPVTLDEELFKI